MSTPGGNRYNYLVVFFATLGSITYGFNNSIMGTVLDLDSFFHYFDLPETGPKADHTQVIIGTTQGIFYAGGIIGCGIAGWMANRLGRQRAVQVICALCIISAILQAAAVHIAMLLVGRLLNGAGSAMINVVVPLYQSEISPPVHRGRMVGSHGALIVVGYAFAAWTGLGCYFEQNPQIQWRLCLALQCAAPLVLLAGSAWLPESPRWLIANGKLESARQILNRLHGDGKNTGNTMSPAALEFRQIESQLEIDSRSSAGLITMLKSSSHRRRFLIGLFVQCLAQSTGVLVINNYQVTLYAGLGLSGWMPLMLYGIYTTWAAILNYAGAMIVDRIGRVRMLSIGMVGCASMVACEAAMVAQYGNGPNKVGNGFGVLFLFLFVTFYGGCVDAISYVYCSELFPTNIRAQGMGFSILGLFAMTLLYTQTAPVAFDSVGWRFYLLFIIVPFVGVPFLWFGCPETKGMTLEEIGALFGDTVATDVMVPGDEKRDDSQSR